MMNNLKVKYKILTFFALLFFASYSPLYAIDSWPTYSEWVPVLNANWDNLTDVQDFSQGSLDVVSDVNGTSAYFWSNGNTLFFRLPLRRSPETNQGGSLRQFAWAWTIDVDNDQWPDWNITAGGITETLRTYFNTGNDLTPDVINYEVQDPLSSGDVQLVPGGYSS